MKKILLFVLVCFVFNSAITGQLSKQITSLYGFESGDQTTHLIYGTEEGYFPYISQVFNFYHHNTFNNSDTLKFRGYYYLPPSYPIYVGELVKGFFFLDNDPDKFIYIMNEIDMDTHGKVVKYDNPIFYSSFSPLEGIWIDKNNQNNIYLQDIYSILPSTTGGNDWGTYSIPYHPIFIAANPYNSAVVFGIESFGDLYRSLDTGRTNHIVSGEFYWSLNTKMCFDKDEKHVYAISDSSFRMSYNSGSPFTWQNIKTFNSPHVNLAVDESVSGTVYISAGRNLYYSTDYGNTLTLIKSFDRVITGIYKKPNQAITYVAFKHKIISVDNSGNILPNFNVNIPINKYLSLYPLKVGYSWTYKTEFHDYSVSNPCSDTTYYRISIVGEEYFDSVKYYKFSDNSYRRIDTTTGLVYTRSNISGTAYEDVIFDLAWTDGDTTNFEGSKPTIVKVCETDTSLNSSYLFKKSFEYYEMFSGGEETFVENIGFVSTASCFDFGSAVTTLMGWVRDGVVYGDTTLVGVDDEYNNQFNYSLSQNYPNPFNPVTNINFSIPTTENVTLKVYDILGKEVATLVNGELLAGNHSIQFSGENLSSGLYVYQLKTDNYFAAKKMLLIK